MDGIDPKAFEFAISKITDGNLFEKFTLEYLTQVLGYKFNPVGGLRDRGIDGFEHLFSRDSFERYIYQISIEKNCLAKLENTIKTLFENHVEFERIFYVTNQVFPEKDKVIDALYEKHKKLIQIYDMAWLTTQINYSEGTVRVFHVFVDTHMHQFSKPGKSYEISDLVKDPRLFVFLRQQWDYEKKELKLDEILADTLILYCLEGTDPEKEIFKTEEQIIDDIKTIIKFDPKFLHETMIARLAILSKKPRQIKYHPAGGYCLPYETRIKIQEKNLIDVALYEAFTSEVDRRLRSYLKVQVADTLPLIEQTIHNLFYQQGLEFANFVIDGENRLAVEKNLPEIVCTTVEKSNVIPKNRKDVENSLLMTIRDIVYNGTPEVKQFLKKLSNTYMMLFMLQCDPKICTFFGSMASRLTVYVCTSIIIPALSEFYLAPVNKRHWNLLVGAQKAGVNLVINETILNELVFHFRMIVNKYEEAYRDMEDLYLGDELQLLYIEEIMIRAYFYAKMRGQTQGFYDFIDNFVSPELVKMENLAKVKDELTEWLREEFGIRFKSDATLGIGLDKEEVSKLYEELKNQKSRPTAKSDSRLILTIYSIREKNNETDSAGIFGYKTWWLSKDTLTQKTVTAVFKDKYRISCYMRPDFLYNYISLAPSKAEVDEAYQELFPSLLGVNVSYHLPEDIIKFVHKRIAEHKSKNHSRLRAILRGLVEELKVNPAARDIKAVQHFLDERLKTLVGEG